MFSIRGTGVFSESDMYIGEKLTETLKNEGFDVKKDYHLAHPAKLILQFGVETTDDRKAESLFAID